jgi:two-component system, NarL family, sensor kinase
VSTQTSTSGALRVWPASRLAAIALAALAALILAGSLILYALTRQNLAENGGQDVIIFGSFVTVGLVIAWHRPGNPIGWIILAAVDFQGLAIASSVYVTLARRPGYHLPVGPLVWLNSAWFVGIAGVPLVILLFPDGRPPSPRWRRVMWSYIAIVGCYLACTGAAATGAFTVLLPSFWLLFVVAQVMSWRRSSGERRQQLKWLMAGAGILAVSQAVIQPIGSNPNLSAAAQSILNTVSAISLAALPPG